MFRRHPKPLLTNAGRERLIAIMEPGAGSYFRALLQMSCSPTLLAAVDATLLDRLNGKREIADEVAAIPADHDSRIAASLEYDRGCVHVAASVEDGLLELYVDENGHESQQQQKIRDAT